MAGQFFDVRQFRSVGDLDLDHVYTGMIPGLSPMIEYGGLGLGIALEAGPSHTHLVCYAPKGEPYVCIENYTCSTDAHNLFDRGYAAESGLKVVPAGGTYADRIVFRAVRG